MGHEACGLFRPIVAPTCAADPRDVSEMAQAHSFGVDPKGAAALAVDGWASDLGIPPAREMGDKGMERLAMGELPGPREGQDVPVAQLWDERQLGLGGLSITTKVVMNDGLRVG
jgi:hypothetical protein